MSINYSEPDHVPLYFKWWDRPYLLNEGDRRYNQFERVKKTLELGIDDTVGFAPHSV